MKEITAKKRVDKIIEESGFLRHFSSTPKELHVYQYEKGELLTAPFEPLKQLLFIVKGEIRIYGLREDGGMYSVSVGEKSTLLGDMEFSGYDVFPYYTEVIDTVLCISIPFLANRVQLEEDPVFLRYIIWQLAAKLKLSTHMELSAQTLEEKVLLYLKESVADHTIREINLTVERLHCSRRQLQRVLKKLCEEGKVVKEGKGCYRLHSQDLIGRIR